MNLLKIDMPPFVNKIFVSQAAKLYWEPRIEKASNAYYKLEMETVKEDIRSCTTAHVADSNLTSQIRWYAKNGLTYIPLRKVGAYQGFAHYHPPVIEGQPWSWYGVLANKAEYAEEFAYASDVGDHGTIGRLLGYGQCCTNFFNNVWSNGWIDPVWNAAIQTNGCNLEREHLVTIPHSETFSGLRYLGLRLAANLPCSFSCEHTQNMVESWIALGRDMELVGLDELICLLNMPVKWSCLKGIAIITTPIFKISTNSVPVFPEICVHKKGDFTPKSAAKGLGFPFDSYSKSQLVNLSI